MKYAYIFFVFYSGKQKLIINEINQTVNFALPLFRQIAHRMVIYLSSCYSLQIINNTYLISPTKRSVKAEYIDLNHIKCKLPNKTRSYLFSVSNNGVNYTQPAVFQIYDPTCLICSTPGKCTLRVSTIFHMLFT